MANTITPYLTTWLAAGLPVLRNACRMPQLVSTDYDMNPTAKGSTIDFPVPPVLVASDVTPAATPPQPQDSTPSTVQLALDKHKMVPFFLTDKEKTQIAAGVNFIPQNLSAAISALANQVNSDIMAATHGASGFYGFVGTAGTNPFASAVDAAADARGVLNEQLAPDDGQRSIVLGSAADTAALKLSGFTAYDGGGSVGEASRVSGLMGRRFGFDFYMDQQIPSHTSGTGSGYLLNGALSAGATTAVVDTGSGTILAGDIVTFAGVTGTYRVTAALASNSFTFYPPLAGAAADNAAVTVKATHVVNLAFHRNAIAFASRPFAGDVAGVPGELASNALIQDPVSGLIMDIEVYRGFKQTMYYVSMLYGVKVVRPELGCRIAG